MTTDHSWELTSTVSQEHRIGGKQLIWTRAYLRNLNGGAKREVTFYLTLNESNTFDSRDVLRRAVEQIELARLRVGVDFEIRGKSRGTS